MKLYRVCTENKNYQNIVDRLDIDFPDGYTIINANGAWQGQREKSLIIEIVCQYSALPDPDICLSLPANIGHFAYWLKKSSNQQAVMVQTLDITERII